MTYKEAIEILKRNKPTSDPRICGKELCTACDVAIEALEKQKWHKISDVKPTEEKQYLCCYIYTDRPFFKVLSWSNNLYEVDEYDFYERIGKSGFYAYDSEYGYYKSDCDYWQEIDWSDEE